MANARKHLPPACKISLQILAHSASLRTAYGDIRELGKLIEKRCYQHFIAKTNIGWMLTTN